MGIPAAPAVAASVQAARAKAKAGREALSVTALHDTAEKYLTEPFGEGA